jgi:glycosidase
MRKEEQSTSQYAYYFKTPNGIENVMQLNKHNVYQVFTRLFGNTNTTNKPWGTIDENGIGKLNDFTETALSEIKNLGITHIWFTGIPHHAVINDFSAIGISDDHPAVVKGRAGSPYAVKDYYSVNPDLASAPSNAMEEFEALIARCHAFNLKVIIDIVPNHVARKYEGKNNPVGIIDFGVDDNINVEYHRDNNFYYVPNTEFELPDIPEQFSPLGGQPLTIKPFQEYPAKWTGNGARHAKPDFDDWYETVKVNYGVKPDGSHDFPSIPNHIAKGDCQDHFNYWRDQDLPNSWYKFRDIALFWLNKGVDGFRYDMAEMVPVEFWSFMNSSIKQQNPAAFLMAEVYQPHLYRDYIHIGKMDYLYDKVDLYDTLKGIIQGHTSTQEIARIQAELSDIEHHMLHFLDNHDEQRFTSPEFAGDARFAKPAMIVSALLSTSPTMLYFGQEVGEPGAEMAGFGQPSRTSIFDYIGVPHHQRWMNNGKFDGGQLSDDEKSLRQFYQRIMNFTLNTPALTGDYHDLYHHNRENMKEALHDCFMFARSDANQAVLAFTNFSSSKTYTFTTQLPHSLIEKWQLKEGRIELVDHIDELGVYTVNVTNNDASIKVSLPPFASIALTLQI